MPFHSIIRAITGPRCPVAPDKKAWIEERLRWLQRTFGPSRVLAPVLHPALKALPQVWNGTKAEALTLLDLLCEYMDVERGQIRIGLVDDESSTHLRMPGSTFSHSGAAGSYHGRAVDGVFVIKIARKQLENPGALVATICHELGHVLLMGGGKLTGREADNEQLTDLLTVYFGAGIFTANSAFEFRQWQDPQMQGWEMNRLGYLTEAELAYSLACYAWLRAERSPKWSRYLASNILPYFKDALHFLNHTADITLIRVAG